MRKNSEQTVGRTDGALRWASGFIGITRMLGGILLLGLLRSSVPALSVTLPGSSVALAWDGSPSPEVTGYHVYFGAASGNYTNSVAVGNVTSNTVPGLATGVTYFFAVIAYDANGLESTFSNEIAYTVPGALPIVQIRISPTRQVILTVAGQIGRTYNLQASPDFTTWTVIGAVTPGASGAVAFTDTNAASFPTRFYRTQDTQP